MVQTLERRRKYIGVILSDENTIVIACGNQKVILKFSVAYKQAYKVGHLVALFLVVFPHYFFKIVVFYST